MIIAIAAVDPAWVLAINGQIPWHYSEDLKRFKVLTKGCSVVMGRKTWDSLPGSLPGRRNIVITRQASWRTAVLPDLAALPAMERGGLKGFLRGLDCKDRPLYVIGGAEVYRGAIEAGAVDEIDLTVVPLVDVSPIDTVTRFPDNLLKGFNLTSEEQNPHDPRLTHRRYVAVPQ